MGKKYKATATVTKEVEVEFEDNETLALDDQAFEMVQLHPEVNTFKDEIEIEDITEIK